MSIAAHKLPQKRLLELFSESLELSNSLVFEYNLSKAHFTYISRHIQGCIGYDQGHVLKHGKLVIPELVHIDDLPRVLEFVLDIRKNSDLDNKQITFRSTNKGGEEIWVRTILKAGLRDVFGQMETVSGICTNVTSEMLLSIENTRNSKSMAVISEFLSMRNSISGMTMANNLDSLRDVLGVDSGVFARKMGAKWSVASHSMTQFEPFDIGFECNIEDTLCQYVTKSEPLVIEDTSRDELSVNLPSVKFQGITSYVGIPVKNGIGICGYLCFFNFGGTLDQNFVSTYGKLLKMVGNCMSGLESENIRLN